MSAIRWLLPGVVSLLLVQAAVAQQANTQRGGFTYLAKPQATGEERNNQPDLWVLEVQFKSLRMMAVPITDRATGQKTSQVVHYLVYKVINRELERRKDETDETPVNTYDAPPGPHLFVPECVLAVEDNGQRNLHKDEILPEAQAAIERRERLKLLNSVQAVQPVPPPAAADDTDPEALTCVAIFRGIDPDADHYTLYLTGLSNGYKLVKGPVGYDELKQMAADGTLQINNELWNGRQNEDWRAAGDFEHLYDERYPMKPGADQVRWFYTVTAETADENTTVWRKTLVQRYWRPGDRFEQFEQEIRVEGEPIWIYRPDAPRPEAPLQTAGK